VTNEVCIHCTFSYQAHKRVLGNACCPDGGNVFGSKPRGRKRGKVTEAVRQMKLATQARLEKIRHES
jgi:hypothetical protein